MKYLLLLIFVSLYLGASSNTQAAGKASNTLRVATFNVSIEATNYLGRKEVSENPSRASVVQKLLAQGDHPQMKNIAEIIQRTRPDVLLLNEFDYVTDPQEGIQRFIDNYLNVSQNAQPSIDYPHYYIAPVNTGVASPFDFDNDGEKSGVAGDAFGFGFYPGQYGMAILSRFPIELDKVRTLQMFLWKDMPNALRPLGDDGGPWYSPEEWRRFRLSSKSHWDVPVKTNSGIVHVIASHPTPPTFDGAEDRNGKRNHDEIRLVRDYLSNRDYLYDDRGVKGGLKSGSRFVVLGDLNSSPNQGDSIRGGIQGLLDHPLVNSTCVPTSKAGHQLRPDNAFSMQHTAAWGLRVDYALPSKLGLDLTGCGIFWPTENRPESRLVSTREASSDHRLVWVDLLIK